jgi:hypothetical protein
MRKHCSGELLRDRYGRLAQWASEFEITLFKKPCRRSLKPVGTSKTRIFPSGDKHLSRAGSF